MTLDDLVPIVIVVTFALFLVIERVVPARPLPHVRWWFLKGIAFFVMCFVLNGAVPAIALGMAGDHTLLHLASIGTIPGALLVLLVTDLVNYWIHRGMHNSQPVWRWTHQLHHSAERMDMMGAVYFHPFDFLGQTVLPGVAIALALGVSPLAGAVGGMAGFVIGVFPHLNVRTPAWLGYVIQRPEMHAVHHLRGVHAYNYGFLAFSDLLFGTWRNPAEFPAEAYGFWDGASSRTFAMLFGRDVGRP